MLFNQKESGSIAKPEKNWLYAWDGVILYVTQEYLSKSHAHFPALLQIGLGTQFAVTLDQQPRSYHDIVYMAPNVSHSTDSENQPYLAILIDPDHELYRYVHAALQGRQMCSLPVSCLQPLRYELAQLIAGELDIVQVKQLLLRILKVLSPQVAVHLPWDVRILKACEYIKQQVPHHIPTVADVAAQVGLSESRLMHLFSAQLGASMRQYMLWLKVRYAIQLWIEGYSLIDLAFAAGFSDQAHYTRTLRRMVDFAPSILKANTVFIGNTFVQPK
ncbi:helix-turn-helix transcriptional regulator [Acinetobacter sp. ANC 4178]|uniref:helix-turn-helix transcriptional regulator n=1 Tax=Acinetobacter sp. ANC 4178 TaxID=2529839 RepID=UPI00103A7A7F|nr:AraC family transcriptional regulator [Acinetobacter sp. ANC 4178]TCB67116.1 AraC family transcriptional regulator [Acinetobacter sp. ANC 4178]